MNTEQSHLIFVDKFVVPQDIETEFEIRMNFNRGFIKNLQGFINDEVFKTKLNGNTIQYLTIAKWENQEALNNAKQLVQMEYKRIGFDPIAFLKKNLISLERQEYKITSNSPNLKILVFGKATSNLKTVINLLQSQHYQVSGTTTMYDGLKLIKNASYDVLIVGGAAIASDLGAELFNEAKKRQIKIMRIDKNLVDIVLAKGQQELVIYYLEEVIPQLKKLEKENAAVNIA